MASNTLAWENWNDPDERSDTSDDTDQLLRPVHASLETKSVDSTRSRQCHYSTEDCLLMRLYTKAPGEKGFAIITQSFNYKGDRM